jgi:F-type H+-transporting ATPase subunit b
MTNSEATYTAEIAVPAPESGRSADAAGELLQVSGPLVLLTWVTFLLMAWVLYRIAWKPILKGLDQRERSIQQALDDAAKARAEFTETQARSRQLLLDAENRSRTLVEEARVAAQELRDRLREDARTEAAGLVESARRDIELQVGKARHQLRAEAADLAVGAASRLLRENLDSPRNRALTERWLREA